MKKGGIGLFRCVTPCVIPLEMIMMMMMIMMMIIIINLVITQATGVTSMFQSSQQQTTITTRGIQLMQQISDAAE